MGIVSPGFGQRHRCAAQDTGSRGPQNRGMRLPKPCLLLAAALSSAAAAQTPPALATLAWLAGCWQSELDEPGSGEQWMAPAGGTMLGMARTLKGGRAVQFEFMQIREAAGGLVFIAQPGGRQASSFQATEVTAQAAVFERSGPDFPQRVAYRRRADGGIAARIEGEAGGVPRGVDFPLRRVACGGSSTEK
jgi:hypothetical protein